MLELAIGLWKQNHQNSAEVRLGTRVRQVSHFPQLNIEAGAKNSVIKINNTSVKC